MRVTNSMLVSKYLNNLSRNMGKQDKLLNQMANNRKVAHYSDDPTSFIYSQAARQRLNRLEGYQKMVETAQRWTAQVEAGIMELNRVIVSVCEECINTSTDVKDGSDKNIVSGNIGQMRDQLLQALNTSFGDKYVFGGYNTVGYTQNGKVIPPFTVDEATGNLKFNNCDLMDPAQSALIASLRQEIISLDVGPGISLPITLNGIDVVMIPEVKIPILDENGDPVLDPVTDEPTYKTVNNMYNLLDELFKAAEAGWPATVISNTFITPLQKGQQQLLSFTSELGGRTNRLEMLESRYSDDEITYYQMKSDAEDADQAELIMNYKMAESVYKAALAAGSYVIKPTLMEFLR